MLIRAFYHIYLAVKIKVGASHRECRAPLTGSGFGSYTFKSLLFGIIGLCDCGIKLVRAAGVVTLKFIIYLCRSTELFFKAVCTNQRRRTVHLIEITDLFGNLKERCVIIKLLGDQFFTKYACKLFCLHRLVGGGIKQRCRFIYHIGTQVIPCLWHLAFIKIDFIRDFFVFHYRYLHMVSVRFI